MKTIIVGGVAGGASCAARLRRLDEKAEILMVERGPYVSYANCGLPYHVGGVIEKASSLLVASEQIFQVMFGIEVRTICEAVSISPKNKTVDLRNTDEAMLQRAETKFRGAVALACEAEGVGVETRTFARFEPVDFDPRVIDIVEGAAADLGLSSRRMPSGAGHDAQMFARVCPTAMIFTKSVNGISHNVTEYTEPEDLEAGANVLLSTMLALAGREFA